MSLRFEDDFLKKLEYLHVVSKRAFAGQNRADRLHAEARPRPRVRRSPSLRARRRLPPHRLEGLQAPEPAAAAAVRRGAGPADLPDARRQPLDGRAGEVRHGAAHRRGALLHRPRAPRSPDDPAVRRGLGARIDRRAAARGGSSACSSCSSSWRPAGRPICAQSCKEFASRPRQLGLDGDHLRLPRSAAGCRDAGLKILRTLGHDVFAVHVDVASAIAIPGALGEVRFVDAETGELREVEVTPRLAAAYVQAWEAHAERAGALLRPLRHRLRPRRRRAAVRRDRAEGVPSGTVPRMTFGAMAAWQAWLLLAAAPARSPAALFLLKLRPPRMLVPSLLAVAARARRLARADAVGAHPPRGVARSSTDRDRAGARRSRRPARAPPAAAGAAARGRVLDRARFVVVDAGAHARAARRDGSARIAEARRRRRGRRAATSRSRRRPTAWSRGRPPIAR